MAWWSIGPIVGQYQPEDFTETQHVEYAKPPTFGTVPPLIFKFWSPRVVTVTFVVNAMVVPASEEAINQDIKSASVQSDPEVVWATVLSMMRRQGGSGRTITAGEGGSGRGLPAVLGRSSGYKALRVTIPGWGVGTGLAPKYAVITDASFKRTHIAGIPSRCVRGIISVTLEEQVLEEGQRRFTEQEAEAGLRRVFIA